MKFKSGDYSGEKFSDGSLRILKKGRLVGEIYVQCNATNGYFGQKQFESLCRAIEKNCHPYKGGIDDDTM